MNPLNYYSRPPEHRARRNASRAVGVAISIVALLAYAALTFAGLTTSRTGQPPRADIVVSTQSGNNITDSVTVFVQPTVVRWPVVVSLGILFWIGLAVAVVAPAIQKRG